MWNYYYEYLCFEYSHHDDLHPHSHYEPGEKKKCHFIDILTFEIISLSKLGTKLSKIINEHKNNM